MSNIVTVPYLPVMYVIMQCLIQTKYAIYCRNAIENDDDDDDGGYSSDSKIYDQFHFVIYHRVFVERIHQNAV